MSQSIVKQASQHPKPTFQLLLCEGQITFFAALRSKVVILDWPKFHVIDWSLNY